MGYQDEWVKGKVARNGYRGCGLRYEMVRAVCSDFCVVERRRCFTVCDIGANLCYFGIRLSEDFPGAEVVAFESHVAAHSRAQGLIAQNGARVELHRKRLRVDDVYALASARVFDVVLALSVLHHVSGDPNEWMSALRKLGRVIVVEIAGLDSHRPSAHGTKIPQDATLIGVAPSHLDESKPRPIYVMKGAR